eukprot:GHUV01017551.1.p1 GENE.GHUV01017551.1~~GHUV01017551.1.p1  ORF type:complete len:225 (+),score=39.71 GHUV01017551.1:354-1028(+)
MVGCLGQPRSLQSSHLGILNGSQIHGHCLLTAPFVRGASRLLRVSSKVASGPGPSSLNDRSTGSSKSGVSVTTSSPPKVKANSAAAAAHPSDDSDADPLLKTLASEAEDDGVDTGAAGWAATIGVVGGIAILLGGGYIFKDAIKQFLEFFIQAVDDWGVWGYVAYAVVYAGLEVLAVPAIPLTMTAGVIFGPLPGTVIVSVSATVAATIAFLIARYAARDKVRW